MRLNRRNTIWIALFSVLMALVLISPNITPPVQALLLGLFMLSVAGAVLDANVRERLLKNVSERVTSGNKRGRVSPQAREARERAAQRGSYYADHLELIDIGVIAAQSGSEGLVMRRTRSVSKDDDGARPFITLYVPPEEAEQNATLRFEFIDQNGEKRYVHQMQVYLRDGDMNVLADHHMPLYGNDEIAGMGDWDMRVYLDNVLVGVHNFQLTASTEERRRRVDPQRYVMRSTPGRDEDEQIHRRLASESHRDAPMSLEDLLRGQEDVERRNQR